MEGASPIETRRLAARKAFVDARPWKLFVLVIAILIVVVRPAAKLVENEATVQVALIYLALSVPTWAWVRAHLRRAGISMLAYLGAWPTGRELGQGALLWLSFYAASYGTAYLCAAILGAFDPNLIDLYSFDASPAQPYESAVARTLAAATAVLLVSVLAPVTEELLFRGALLDTWAPRWGRTRAWLASAAFFGVAHGPMAPSTFVMALAMSSARQLTGGLWLPIAVHAAINTLPVLNQAFHLLTTGQTPGESVNGGSVGLGLLLLAVGLPYPLLYIRRGWSCPSPPLGRASASVSPPA